jgi:hypothetical protein
MDTPFWQSNAFWVGIVVSAVASLPIGIAANFFYYRLSSYLDSRKLKLHGKRRDKAIVLNSLITDLHENKRDRSTYFILQLATLTMPLTAGVGFLSASAVILALNPHSDEVTVATVRPLAYSFLLLAVTYFCFTMVFLTIRRMQTVVSALNDYDRYVAEFREKWGDP